MPEEEVQQQEERPKKKGGGLLPIIISAVISAAVAFVVLLFIGPMVIGQNQTQQAEGGAPGETRLVQPREITAVLISSGSNETFPLKGAREVVVLDFLTFKVGSDACRAAIAEKKPEILDALSKIFFSKGKSELSSAAGIELLKSQIRDAVNRITGFVGDKEAYGVINVYIRIKAFASTE